MTAFFQNVVRGDGDGDAAASCDMSDDIACAPEPKQSFDLRQVAKNMFRGRGGRKGPVRMKTRQSRERAGVRMSGNIALVHAGETGNIPQLYTRHASRCNCTRMGRGTHSLHMHTRLRSQPLVLHLWSFVLGGSLSTTGLTFSRKYSRTRDGSQQHKHSCNALADLATNMGASTATAKHKQVEAGGTEGRLPFHCGFVRTWCCSAPPRKESMLQRRRRPPGNSV